MADIVNSGIVAIKCPWLAWFRFLTRPGSGPEICQSASIKNNSERIRRLTYEIRQYNSMQRNAVHVIFVNVEAVCSLDMDSQF